jgi:hypothetical protein
MKPLRLLFSVCLLILAITVTAQVKSSSGDKKMNDFIDGLMSKMTLQEKLGQMNLPASGDITTGEAESSDISIKIKEGKVGGLFNIKSVEKIKEVQRIAVEESRLKIPLILGWMLFMATKLFSQFHWD